MKAQNFEYHRPETLEAALALMAAEDAVPLAGGQSLMPMMNFRLAAPDALIDLNGLTDLAGIEVADGWLHMGAMTRYHQLEASADIQGHLPLIALALPQIAHPAIRNRGTIGGSCALADPAAEMPALLLALGGEISLQNQAGSRRVAAEDFFLGLYETAREENELVTNIHIPIPPDRVRTGFHEITRRHGDYAMAGCAIAASRDLTQVRLALFGVSACAFRVAGAEDALAGSDGGETAVHQAVEALSCIDIDGDLHSAATTKRHLAAVALRRAWAEVMR